MLVGHYLGIFDQSGWETRFRKEIPLNKLDYLCLAFAQINLKEGKCRLEFTHEEEQKALTVIEIMRRINPEAQIFVTVIADGEHEDHFIEASNDPDFPKEVLNFLEKYKLDGFDIDWEEYLEKSALQRWVKALHQVLNPVYKRLLMTIRPELSDQYDISLMGELLDRIQIMCYGADSDPTSMIKTLIKGGIPNWKLTLGIETEIPYPGGTDDQDSIKTKIQLVRDYGLGGVVAWRMDNDHTEKEDYPTYGGVDLIWSILNRQ